MFLKSVDSCRQCLPVCEEEQEQADCNRNALKHVMKEKRVLRTTELLEGQT